MKRILIICVVFALLTTAANARLFTLADLLAGETITSGDKLFSDFGGWESTSVDAADITVVPYQNPDNLEYGLLFASDVIQLDTAGGISIAFDYFVTPTQPGYLISDNTLTMEASGWGGVTIIENARDAANEDNLLATKTTYWQLNGAAQKLADHAVYPVPVQSVHVYKDILLSWSGGTTPGPQLTEFTQTFSQVPEPATLILLGLGGLLLRKTRRV